VGCFCNSERNSTWKHRGQNFTRQCSYTNHVRWANYTSSSCKFPTVYMCQKLWKLAGSRQSYCKNKQAYFFGPPCTIHSHNANKTPGQFNVHWTFCASLKQLRYSFTKKTSNSPEKMSQIPQENLLFLPLFNPEKQLIQTLFKFEYICKS